MTSHRMVSLAFAIATFISGLVAAYYWYRSSRPAPAESMEPMSSIEDDQTLHILSVRVDLDGLRTAMIETSRLNKYASIWSAFAAGFGAIASLIGTM